uniref:Uncharacterized protein n=1 Tax=Physcomitrium patens TaxID=3218 RepID=A0A2K1IGB0_PHYPA|nr:hypothetical protein PHYPA_028908 [Physcomitrium patens]
MRNDENEGWECRCAYKGAGSVGTPGAGMGMLCESCLQFLKQCPPKKRLKEHCMSRPVILKPASGGALALDRLVEVALSPIELRSSYRIGPRMVSEVGSAVFVETKSAGYVGSEVSRCRLDAGDGAAKSVEANGRCNSINKVHTHAAGFPFNQTKINPGFNIPHREMETTKNLKRPSSFNEIAQSRLRSSSVQDADQSRRFTPRFKSLVDLSC